MQLFNKSATVSGLSDLTFFDKTNVLLTFAIASFAAIEGYSTFERMDLEQKAHKIHDARSELEKAYGPLYTIVNKNLPAEDVKNDFWLDFDERKRINEIFATYPFMFSQPLYEFWQERIRHYEQTDKSSSLSQEDFNIDLSGYKELRNIINEEYAKRVKRYNELIEKEQI